MRAIIALAPIFVSAAVCAQDQVRVGNELKNTSGLVKKLEPGDIACYLHMQDERGRAFTELADFDICTQKPPISGKRVRLAYRSTKVPAASCQGNPDCKKTQVVALVVSATIIDGVSQASFCTPQETTVFACSTGAKLVSVCASKSLTPAAGYAQYRFGKAGEPLEMALPAGQLHPRKAAHGESVPFSGGGGSWLRFRNGPVAYVVYTGIGNWGPGGRKAEKHGLVVEKDGKQVAHLRCTGRVMSELGPEWFDKAGFKPNPKEDFDFPD